MALAGPIGSVLTLMGMLTTFIGTCFTVDVLWGCGDVWDHLVAAGHHWTTWPALLGVPTIAVIFLVCLVLAPPVEGAPRRSF